MTEADLHRSLCAAQLDAVGPGLKGWPPERKKGGAKWSWSLDHSLVLCARGQGNWPAVVRASGYTDRRCRARLKRLLPRVPTRDRIDALLAELERRMASEAGGSA